jgi:hypothetical protein
VGGALAERVRLKIEKNCDYLRSESAATPMANARNRMHCDEIMFYSKINNARNDQQIEFSSFYTPTKYISHICVAKANSRLTIHVSSRIASSVIALK